jgi:mono/diheme cytochrome c family protein
MRLPIYLSLLALGLLSAHCGYATESRAPDNERIQQGRAIFLERSCSHCHGPDADTGVRLSGRDDLTPEYIFATIKNGRKSGGRLMPPWGSVLSDDEINSLVAYLMSLQKR